MKSDYDTHQASKYTGRAARMDRDCPKRSKLVDDLLAKVEAGPAGAKKDSCQEVTKEVSDDPSGEA